MENKMGQVAKLLGVELDEEFRIEGLTRKHKLTENGLRCWFDDFQQWYASYYIDELLTGESKIIKLSKPILDEKEKEYLGNIVKPFRNKIIGITKYDYSTNGEYIHIKLKRTISPADYFIPLECIDLPIFKRNTMYKGMEVKKEYTLEQLDL